MRARRRSSLRANSGASVVEVEADGEDDEDADDEDDDASEET